ncbi:aspartate/glutamate racemase family protein [Roseovarius sp. SCSIO 43702]|uniref:maleate cis-trans isomerase family protein n=1 Tax=Roseovarius sp. SCSIO 43702 TaxID=2823043 RepID=UPI001C73CC03|nr:aspartate/glutamate racemase family protein [Roseovarius sp. SCSIO 43702]QYX55578.1 aspartate/glutamate racemase family protein [Roseovarius sp. SCSIO 43702]
MTRYDLDAGAGGGTRIGLVVLSTDETLEHEARLAFTGRDVNLLHARIPSIAEVRPDTLATMADEMTATAALLPLGLSALGYACTSGATVIGPAEVARLLHIAHPNVPVSDPMTAVIAALRALDASRIALVTPYLPSVTAPMRAHLAGHGIEVTHEVSFGEGDDRRVGRITEASTRAAMLEAARAPGTEAIFASCTNLRSFGIIDRVEAETGLPVVTSNQALLWHLVSLAGLPAGGSGPGRLWQD